MLRQESRRHTASSVDAAIHNSDGQIRSERDSVEGEMSKPANTWDTSGMGYSWKEKNPLAGAAKYLWQRLRKYPMDDDWRKPRHRSPMHEYYESGWSLINHLEMILFSASSSCGNSWPFQVCGVWSKIPLFNQRCEWPHCEEMAECIRNQERTKKKEKHGDYVWRWLPDAPQFYCFAHYMEAHYGKKYIPPSEEERMRSAAMWRRLYT